MRWLLVWAFVLGMNFFSLIVMSFNGNWIVAAMSLISCAICVRFILDEIKR